MKVEKKIPFNNDNIQTVDRRNSPHRGLPNKDIYLLYGNIHYIATENCGRARFVILNPASMVGNRSQFALTLNAQTWHIGKQMV